MGVKLFCGENRWKEMHAWRASYPQQISIMGIGTWISSHGVPELYVEFSNGASSLEERESAFWKQAYQILIDTGRLKLSDFCKSSGD